MAAIRSGITKVNVSTHLNGFFTAPIRSFLDANPRWWTPRKYLAGGTPAVTGSGTPADPVREREPVRHAAGSVDG